MATVIQRNFAGGEISPALYSRADTVKYSTGLRTMRNFFIMRQGGAASRPGSSFVAEVKDSTQPVRLIPFIFNANETYVLELGNLYMRVHKNGQQLTLPPGTVTGVTNASPGVFTLPAHGFQVGYEVNVTGFNGTLGNYLNFRNFKVASVTTNTFTLNYMNGTPVNTTTMGAYTSGGSFGVVYEIASPFVTADVSTIQFTQSADVITLAHPNYPPQEIRRSGDAAWTIQPITVAPVIQRPQAVNVTIYGGGSDTISYKVTAVSANNSEESLAGLAAICTITAVTQANPCVMTANYSGSPFIHEGDEIAVDGIGGMSQLNGRTFFARNVSGATFQLFDQLGNAIDSTSYTAYTAGGQAALTAVTISSVQDPTPSAPISVVWLGVTGAASYNVYRGVNGIFGFIGNALQSPFKDVGTSPNLSVSPPTYRTPFAKAGDYPSAVAYIQQRLSFANTNNNPETVYMSRSGQYKNFSTSIPIQASDSVTFGLVGRQVNAVKHMIELSTPVLFTAGAEWTVHGDQSGIISPTSINARQTSYCGSGNLRPIIIGNTAIFLQARGNVVRDLAYSFQADGYTGNDLTIFSNHLFDGYTITDWDYQQIPHSVIWAVRSDGVLLSLTYIKEHDMWGWARHDFTGGYVENVVSIPNGSEDAIYVVVRRTINGTSVRYIERLNQRRIDNIVDFIAVDAAKTYDGRNYTATTMTMTGSAWTYTDTVTLTASSAYFQASDVGGQIDMTGSDGSIIRFSITGYTSSTVVTGSPNQTVPVVMQGTPILNWSRAVFTLTGLWHLEGQNISALGDGYVLASPNNASCATFTVTNGSVTFPKAYAVIQIGLPFTADIETLDIDSVQGESLIDKYKNISRLWMHVQNSRGVWAGSEPPSNDLVNPLENLFELKIRNSENYNQPVALHTGPVQINLQSDWNSNGRVFIRQVDPVPLTILSIAPAGEVPFRVGG